MKKIIMLLIISLFLVSCGIKDGDGDKNLNNTGELKNDIKINNKSDEDIKKEIIESAKRNKKEAIKGDKNKLLKNINNCDGEVNKEVCKLILVEQFGLKEKNIDSCNLLEGERDIKRCKNKIVSRLVSMEKDPSYCSMLEDIDKQMCEEEYNRNLDEEVNMIKNINN